MIDSEQCRRKAEALLTEAARASNMKERGRLIDEAMHWHRLALEAHGQRVWGLDDGAGAVGRSPGG
jgi:hypothetical protein